VHLGAREEATMAGGGRTAAGLQCGIERAGRQGGEEKAASKNPHHNAKLLEQLLDGGEQRSGGAASGRSTEAVAVEELGRLGFFWWNGGCGLGKS
jgi:hypothetical protein